MQWWMVVVGAGVVTVTVFDAFATTLSPSTRAGPVTSRLTAVLWRLAWRGARSNVSPLLVVAGPALLLVTAMVWIGGLWLGWTLIFSAAPDAVVSDAGGIPADLSGRIFYTAFTLFTLGLGNYVPQGVVWEILSSAALLNGLVLVTMAITYFIPVVTAVTERRQVASVICTLGVNPVDILRAGWDGSSFPILERRLHDLVPHILVTGQRHLTYPIIHYFHGRERLSAFAPSVAAFDEAVAVIEHGVAPEARPHPTILSAFHNAMDQYLNIVEPGYARSATEEPPPAVDLKEVADLGIPVVDEDDYRSGLDLLVEHRCRMWAYVRHARWSWEDDVLEASAAGLLGRDVQPSEQDRLASAPDRPGE